MNLPVEGHKQLDRSPDKVVEIPISYAGKECHDFIHRVDQDWSFRIPGVPNGDLPVRHPGHFDTVSAWIAAATLLPNQFW